MRILVLGAAGTVGRVLADELETRQYPVTRADVMHGPEHVRCDIRNFREVEHTIQKAEPDVVYNLAAEFGRWNGEDHYESLWATNVVGLKHVLRVQQERHFRLVHFSSSEVYGDYRGVMTEDVMDGEEIRQLNDYALTKWVNEQQIMNAAAMSGTETVRVRLFNTYGPGEYYTPYRSALCRFCYYALHDLPYTVYLGHQRTSTYITDTVRTLANIAERFHAGQVYNVGGTELHTMKEASDIILKLLGKTDGKVTYSPGEPFTTAVKQVDVSRAVRDLDHRCAVDLRTGLQLTLDWMRRAYNISDD